MIKKNTKNNGYILLYYRNFSLYIQILSKRTVVVTSSVGSSKDFYVISDITIKFIKPGSQELLIYYTCGIKVVKIYLVFNN